MGKGMTKSQLFAEIAARCELSKRQVDEIFDVLTTLINEGLDRDGKITLPGLVKIEKKEVAARPARKGVPNPFKPGELMDVAAKPATTKIKVRPLKKLKDMV